MTLLGDLLEYLNTHRYILVIWGLSTGVAILLLMIVYRSRIPKMSWTINIELAVYCIVMGVLNWLNMYGVDTMIAGGLAAWLFTFAVLTTIVVFLVNKSRGLKYG